MSHYLKDSKSIGDIRQSDIGLVTVIQFDEFGKLIKNCNAKTINKRIAANYYKLNKEINNNKVVIEALQSEIKNNRLLIDELNTTIQKLTNKKSIIDKIKDRFYYYKNLLKIKINKIFNR